MAKPIAVQKLRHGKALCGKTFGGFVDTFNWLVDFCLSLKGDKDVNNANGTVTVDRSDPSAPVIRCSGCENKGLELDPEYFKVEKQNSEDDVPPRVELDARNHTPAIRMPSSTSGKSPNVEIFGDTSPSVNLSGNLGHSTLSENEFYAQGDENGEEILFSADGGKHGISIKTSDATQGDVELRECDYYAPGETTPTKVNVLASKAMRLGIGKTITLSEALDNIVTSGSS